MSARIRDTRRPTTGTKLKDMADGTWFVNNRGLFLRVQFDTCVDVATGKRALLNDEHDGDPVEVEVTILGPSVPPRCER
ncbi:MAG: hypothetical protein JXN60_06150 [Lentisphaerae bacterium]|nr:hypothetical protein [Lentisphaerota bacterium]